ncbi:hypothetical protein BDR04DRAFT_1197860 [Suillus decipiens]|nr:hypothetical protein BDR04DRAFT_1197860 [Suillus decipiens]
MFLEILDIPGDPWVTLLGPTACGVDLSPTLVDDLVHVETYGHYGGNEEALEACCDHSWVDVRWALKVGEGKPECIIWVHTRVNSFLEERAVWKISRVNGRTVLFSIYDFNWHRCFGGDVWALEKLLKIWDGRVGNVNCMLIHYALHSTTCKIGLPKGYEKNCNPLEPPEMSWRQGPVPWVIITVSVLVKNDKKEIDMCR